MTGDGKAIGTKFGIAFAGKWVWKMKDHIDSSFMKLFAPENLYETYDYSKTFQQQKHLLKPLENADALFEEEKASERTATQAFRESANTMSAKAAAKLLACDEEESEFFERLFVIDRMGREEQFMKDVVESYNTV
jgi:hypothetical protein